MIPDIMGLERAAPWLALCFGLGFLLGAVPFGLLVARALGLGDPRRAGSGNIGATNLLRVGGPKAALATLALDAGKGAAAALAAGALLGPVPAAAAGLGAFLGHCYSPFLGFKGGKGVATGFGVLLGWRWEVGLICAAAWLLAALLSKRSSAGALAAAAAAAPALAAFEEWTFVFAAAPMIVVLLWRHRANIGRLLSGEEPPIRLGRS